MLFPVTAAGLIMAMLHHGWWGVSGLTFGFSLAGLPPGCGVPDGLRSHLRLHRRGAPVCVPKECQHCSPPACAVPRGEEMPAGCPASPSPWPTPARAAQCLLSQLHPLPGGE